MAYLGNFHIQMPRQEQILSIFAASPSDVAPERAALEEVVMELNNTWSRSLGIKLELIKWETHAYPGFGSDPQDVINKQLTSDFDIFIGIMWQRFGTATNRAESGTAEEFARAKTRWDARHASVNIMMYFKNTSLPLDQIDIPQLSKVTEFRKSLGSEGSLPWLFDTTETFVNLIRVHLARVVQEWHSKSEIANCRPSGKQSEVALSLSRVVELTEEDEPGILDFTELFLEKFTVVGESAEQISKATAEVRTKVEEHAGRMSTLAVAGPVSPSVMKRSIAKVAAVMEKYATRLETQVPILRDAMRDGLEFYSKTVVLWPELIHSEADQQAAAETVTAIRGLRATLGEVRQAMQSMSDSTNKLPRLTTELNRAKRRMRSELQNLVDILSSQEQLLLQAEDVAGKILGTDSE